MYVVIYYDRCCVKHGINNFDSGGISKYENDHCNQNILNFNFFCWLVRSGHQLLPMMRHYFMLLLQIALCKYVALITIAVSTSLIT